MLCTPSRPALLLLLLLLLMALVLVLLLLLLRPAAQARWWGRGLGRKRWWGPRRRWVPNRHR